MEKMLKKSILVISGINIVDGGALSVFKDCLNELIKNRYNEKYKILALVGNKSQFKEFDKDIELIEFPLSKKNWLFRLYYEYFYFYKLSKKLKIKYWLSMHDITPNVKVEAQFVYCHNPSPFYKMRFSDVKYSFKNYLFTKFYKYLYKINIHKNKNVIVQQEWIRNEFKKMYNINNVIVARPSLPIVENVSDEYSEQKKIFVCPSYPRFFKNFEVVCEAAKSLENKGVLNFEVYVTIDGSENKYAHDLVSKYKNVKSIKFCGLLTRDELYQLYHRSCCLLFLSKLETWGMPILEFKATNRAMILSDLPYSHETAGNYNNIAFVNPNDYEKLSLEMNRVINHRKLGNSNEKVPSSPYAQNWRELFKLIF